MIRKLGIYFIGTIVSIVLFIPTCFICAARLLNSFYSTALDSAERKGLEHAKYASFLFAVSMIPTAAYEGVSMTCSGTWRYITTLEQAFSKLGNNT